MSRFSATSLDLSRFPAPLAIRGFDYEGVLSERMARLVSLFDARGIDYDVAELETDPGKILQENDAYRELLVTSKINDAVRSVMVAFAIGAELDHLAAFYGIARLDGELDPQFRRRVLLAPEAFSTAGSRGAYVYHALSTSGSIANVDVWKMAPGLVRVAIQSSFDDGVASAGMIELVRQKLHQDDIKPLTDTVSVVSAKSIPYTIDVDVFVLPGPDPVAVKLAVEESLAKMVAARFTPARDVPPSAIHAAATVGPVDRVIINSPVEHIARNEGELAYCTGIKVKVQTHDG